MSALSLMLQSSPSALPDAAPIEAQPLSDAAQAAGDVAAAVPANSLDLLDLVLKASIPVQLIMLLLVVASIASWVIIFRKAALLRRAKREAEQFEERFWSGAELGKLYEGASSRGRDVGGMEAIFEAGFRDFNRLRQRRGADSDAQLEAAQRGMRATASRELDSLEHNLELLANIGSTSPYIGLVGTVFGIMVTMHSLLASSQQVGIKDVAPGISEALLATAMGLFVAIPAVWAYNRFATAVERLATRYEAFAEEFSSILQRQSHLEG
ncbi:protein TolQ [Lysobacter xinjiangensis]|uniref:Tol-Pal system protein TolQ n=2 Tax=Cognatilysobacter xinjiangensis TaxID=546892 RepID=A0ABQ3BMI6_9GAMM|nr:protein TolQ [Lysobacter xinjiangensis]GGZ51694.1 protein TolQ [Lysobacter xinjiangensis]